MGSTNQFIRVKVNGAGPREFPGKFGGCVPHEIAPGRASCSSVASLASSVGRLRENQRGPCATDRTHVSSSSWAGCGSVLCFPVEQKLKSHVPPLLQPIPMLPAQMSSFRTLKSVD
jgi:hypothetical protein